MSSVAISTLHKKSKKCVLAKPLYGGQNFEDKVLYNERYLTLERRQTATMLFEL